LDILLLHAPDPLMIPEEIGEAFDALKRAGKVRHFGVSNFSAAQIERVQRKIGERLIINQIQLGLAHAYPIIDGSEFVVEVGQDIDQVMFGRGEKDQFSNAYVGAAAAGTFDYCCLNDIQIQAWSPLRGELLSPASANSPKLKKAAELLNEIAARKGVTPPAIALAWLLFHPAGIVPVIGTSSPDHLIANCEADGVTLTRNEWYALFASAGRLSYRAS
jgi:predicted oxidoreductase